jgi:hypothetical protein
MIRITTSDEPTLTAMTVDGRLSADCIHAVEICRNRAMSRGTRTRLFLHDVSVIDNDDHTLLRHLAAKGVGLSRFRHVSRHLPRHLTTHGRELAETSWGFRLATVLQHRSWIGGSKRCGLF